MKQLIFTFLFLMAFGIGYSQKDECDKYFFKQKKSSKKSVFFSDSSQLIKTKYSSFFTDARRNLSFCFMQESGKQYLSFQSKYVGDGFKRRFVLGQDFILVFMLSDSSTIRVKFNGNEQKATNYSNNQGSQITYNSTPLTDTLLKILMVKPIIYYEIQNPFGTQNESIVRSEKLDYVETMNILKTASCFYNRIHGIKVPVVEEN